MFMRLVHSLNDGNRTRVVIGPLHHPARPRCTLCASGGGSIIRGGIGFTSLFIGACLSQTLHAQSTTFTATAALSSQLVDRGQAITGNTPVLQGAASWTFTAGGAAPGTFPSGWSLDLMASTQVRPPRRGVALVQVSRYGSLSAEWQMQVGLRYYTYAGHIGSNAFDRAETGVNLTYRDVLNLGLSVIYVVGATGHQPRGAADLDLHWPLARHFSLSIGAGVTQSLAARYGSCRCGDKSSENHGYESPYGRVPAGHYSYGHVGVSWGGGSWRIELDRIVTAPEAKQQWGNSDAWPWVATVSRSF